MESNVSKAPKAIPIVFGYFFVINYVVGTGFLGIPYSFYNGGLLAGVITLLATSFLAWNTAAWEVEVMARAQALETYSDENRGAGAERSSKETDPLLTNVSSPDIGPFSRYPPKYEILLTRKFEITELCHVFCCRWVKYLYLMILTINSFLAGWSFSTVAGSAWSTNIPFHSGPFNRCSEGDFHQRVYPEEEACFASYRICVLFFAIVVVPLSCLDLKEQGIIQMVLGLLRFTVVISMVTYCVVKLVEQGGSSQHEPNSTITLTQSLFSSGQDSNNSCYTSNYPGYVTHFKFTGWLVAIPVFMYAQGLHQGVPALTHPIRQKYLLRWLIMAVFITTSVCYTVLGITVSLWFTNGVLETTSLNWVPSTHSSSVALRVLSYFIILFPSLDVCSAYPLLVFTIVNNLYTVFFGRDTSQKVHSYEWVVILIMKAVFAILPIVASLFVTNLVYVLKYAGLMGFFICFFFPTLLQLMSERKCVKVFGPLQVSSFHGPLGRLKDSEGDSNPLLIVNDTTEGSQCNTVGQFSVYMTPYSNVVLSHPITVSILGLMGVGLFILTFIGLFVC